MVNLIRRADQGYISSKDVELEPFQVSERQSVNRPADTNSNLNQVQGAVPVLPPLQAVAPATKTLLVENQNVSQIPVPINLQVDPLQLPQPTLPARLIEQRRVSDGISGVPGNLIESAQNKIARLESSGAIPTDVLEAKIALQQLYARETVFNGNPEPWRKIVRLRQEQFQIVDENLLQLPESSTNTELVSRHKQIRGELGKASIRSLQF